MRDKLIKAINGITTVLIAAAAVFALAIIAGRPFGIHAYAVLSGSMEPDYPTGSLIYVREAEASDLGPGDVITYMVSSDATATHRIVEVVPGEDGATRFQTKGDANDAVDGELVHEANVIGTPVLAVPLLGYAVNFVQFPPGTYAALSFCAVLVFLLFLPDLLAEGGDEPARKRGRHGRKGAARTEPQVRAYRHAPAHAGARAGLDAAGAAQAQKPEASPSPAPAVRPTEPAPRPAQVAHHPQPAQFSQLSQAHGPARPPARAPRQAAPAQAGPQLNNPRLNRRRAEAAARASASPLDGRTTA